jgi:hypothetical protein
MGFVTPDEKPKALKSAKPAKALAPGKPAGKK